MKKAICIIAIGFCLAACNSESDSTKASADTVNNAPVNDMISNPNRIPGSNTPGEAMGNGDTSSYDRMSQKIDSGR